MVFDDYLLFRSNLARPLGREGRVALIQHIFAAHRSSLRNEFGLCELRLFNGDRELGLGDFRLQEREEAGQPGNRLILTKDDVAQPRWELRCPDAKGQFTLAKSGSYFFIFVDVLENVSVAGSNEDLAKYLFAFRK